MEFFNSGIPGCKTQFCLLNITIKNVLRKNHWPLLMISNQISKDIQNIWKKVNEQPNALVRIPNFASPFQRKRLRNSFIKSYFLYCSFIWMFPYEKLNKKDRHNLRKEKVSVK